MQTIKRGINEMEEYYLAADTLERVRGGFEKSYSAAAVRKALGFDR